MPTGRNPGGAPERASRRSGRRGAAQLTVGRGAVYRRGCGHPRRAGHPTRPTARVGPRPPRGRAPQPGRPSRCRAPGRCRRGRQRRRCRRVRHCRCGNGPRPSVPQVLSRPRTVRPGRRRQVGTPRVVWCRVVVPGIVGLLMVGLLRPWSCLFWWRVSVVVVVGIRAGCGGTAIRARKTKKAAGWSRRPGQGFLRSGCQCGGTSWGRRWCLVMPA
jgi:hypothetical protein